MLAALIIVFCKVIEAGLVVGIVLAVTPNFASSRLWILGGAAGGIAASCLVATFTGVLAGVFEGSGQELFDAAILAIAVGVLVWHNVWMVRHGRAAAGELKATDEAVITGGKSLALAAVAGIAVLHEGSEVVLFLHGIAVLDRGSPVALLLGALDGFALGATVSALTFFGLLEIPARHLFAATSILVALLAAGLAAQCVSCLEQAAVQSAAGGTAWNTASVLSDKSILGRALSTLISYAGQPSYLQIATYIATLAMIFVLVRAFARQPGVRAI